MQQIMAQSPKAVYAVQKDEYTIAELAKELHKSYSQIYVFIRRHNRFYPEAKITPIQRTITGKKIFIKKTDAAIIRDGILHPEKSEKNAWE